MKVYNEEKTKILTNYDLTLGYLIDSTITVDVPEVKEVKEVGHYETVKEYPNGGKDVEWIVDTAGVEGCPAHTIDESIQVYIPYSEEEILLKTQQNYEHKVDMLIREKYTLSQELAILRQRDSKPEEFKAYNDYAEECKAKAKN